MSVQPVLQLAHDGPWTWDDLPTREELRGWRAEIVDGSLLLMAPPKRWHDIAGANLAFLLRVACSEGLFVMNGGSVGYGQTWRQPDAMVFRRDAPCDKWLTGTDVVLVAEVQSPGSVSNDRLVKLHDYASVGIPHYWRVELEPEPLLQAFALVDSVDAEVATVRGEESFTFDEPFPVTICPAALLR